MNKLKIAFAILLAASFAAGQTLDPRSFSISTPRPINPSENSTNPNARAGQSQNPYLGSTPEGQATDTVISLSMQQAIARGLRFNLGLIESNQAGVEARSQRLRALSALLPQVSAQGEQAFERLSLKEIGLKLPPIPGFSGLPSVTDNFGFQDARVSLSQTVYSAELQNHYRSERDAEKASSLEVRDARDVVVYVVGAAYLEVVAAKARLESAKAQLLSAQTLDQQASDQVTSEVSPEIDSIRARVERQTAEQRVIYTGNELEKDKLTLARITGIPIAQQFDVANEIPYQPLAESTQASITEEAFRSRADLASAETTVRAAEYSLRSKKDERLPTLAINADYGGAGVNLGNFDQVFTVAGRVSLPIFTGGRIHSDIEQAKSELARRKAEYQDLRGRVAYDVRVAWLDLQASNSSVKVAESNQALAGRALQQAQDRYKNGVTNYLEVVQAQETLAGANQNYIDSLYSFNVAKLSLARATGVAEKHLAEFFGGN
jgi:outer membrane protein TolC